MALTRRIEGQLNALSDQTTRRLITHNDFFFKLEDRVAAIEASIVRLERRIASTTSSPGVSLAESDFNAVGAAKVGQTAPQSTMPTHPWVPETGEAVRQVLRLLRPMSVAEFQKVRLGRDFDGGYVLLDDFAGADAAISMGISDDCSWDLAIAGRGLTVYQFDHTVDGPPIQSSKFVFFKQRVSFKEGPAQISINALLGSRVASGETDLLLKMDIESDEWDVLDSADPALLAHCRQFVCEFHHLDRLADKDFRDRALRCYAKLAEIFFVCHVHANNCGNLFNVGNIALPESLEVTFANKNRYAARETAELFPGPLDMPNQEGRADIFLGSFRF